MNNIHIEITGEDKLDIDGLRLFGYHKMTDAAVPFPLHTHGNCIEITVIIKGGETYWVDGCSYAVTGGQAFFSNVDEIHGPTHSQGISEFVWFQIDMTKKASFLGLKNNRIKDLYNKILGNKERVLTVSSYQIKMIKEVYNNLLKGRTIYANGLMIAFLDELFNQDRNINTNVIEINKAIDYIKQHIADQISFEEICSHVNMSLCAFKHQFKSIVGKTPRNFINELKIKEAQRLLLTGMSITDTAFSLSFNTSEYFATVFKKYTLFTPSEYLRQSGR